ncbi:hypothetical protein WISP_127779 [Willisornis vidua]|uniref:Uncharacterized protein n=1 Tax=Willisornis vidua TaxID=1566151 RepID=A0ABQ9CRH6_9PASS|nr:hypothetical protein WISP_127779 [Willisornis vidua]
MPAGFRMDLLLAKAETIRNVNNSADTKVSAEGGAGDAKAEVLLQAMVQTTVEQLCPGSPWRTITVQRSTCSPWRSPSWNSEAKDVRVGSRYPEVHKTSSRTDLQETGWTAGLSNVDLVVLERDQVISEEEAEQSHLRRQDK